MKQHLGFLKTSSAVVKIAAWIFLVLGLVSGVSTLLGMVPGNPPWMGMVIIATNSFFFFFLFLIAKIADLLTQIINQIVKD